VFVGLLAWLNVRERRPEIGLLRALGKGTAGIAGLFLGKAALLGLLGGALGAAVGFAAALVAGASMEIPAPLLTAQPLILAATILGAPLVAALASYPPTLVAVSQDPSVVLMDC
jgi:putative ABC transport system permease protein